MRKRRKKKSGQFENREYETLNLEKSSSKSRERIKSRNKTGTLMKFKKHKSSSGFATLKNYQTERRMDLKLSKLKNYFSKKSNIRKKSSSVKKTQ